MGGVLLAGCRDTGRRFKAAALLFDTQSLLEGRVHVWVCIES
jgi:hypothetical protein